MTVKEAVTASAAKYALSAELLAAQVLVESSGDPYAFRFEPKFFRTYVLGNVHAKAARFGPLAACSFGPLQIMLETAYELGFTGFPEELFNPAIGMDWGAKYLATLLAWAQGDYTKAWCAFNGGKGAALTLPYANQIYADKILAMKGRPLLT
jgi:hypothetical protein